MTLRKPTLRGLAATLLATASLCASAATVNFSGAADSGPLLNEPYGGSFSFVDPVAGFDGFVDLDSFTMSFFGQTYDLASADTTPVAVFVGGIFTGVDYLDIDSLDPSTRPHVALLAGFFDASEAYLAYDTGATTAGAGFGSLRFETGGGTLPEPGTLAAALAGLALLGAARRRPG